MNSPIPLNRYRASPLTLRHPIPQSLTAGIAGDQEQTTPPGQEEPIDSEGWLPGKNGARS